MFLVRILTRTLRGGVAHVYTQVTVQLEATQTTATRCRSGRARSLVDAGTTTPNSIVTYIHAGISICLEPCRARAADGLTGRATLLVGAGARGLGACIAHIIHATSLGDIAKVGRSIAFLAGTRASIVLDRR